MTKEVRSDLVRFLRSIFVVIGIDTVWEALYDVIKVVCNQ